METIIKQSTDGIFLRVDNKLDTTKGKVFINNHEITDIDTFFKVADENTKLLKQVKKQKEVIDKAIDKLYCWGEALDPIFQKEMLDILQEVSK